MARNENNRLRSSGRMAELLLDGKRTILAGGLILVMAFMWMRVLFGHKPGSAAAAPEQKSSTAVQQKEPARPRMIEIPTIAGRHDVILRDCFQVQDWTPFRPTGSVQDTGTDTEVPVVPPNHDQEVMQQVAQTLKLEAVTQRDDPLACVNDRWVRVGDRFTVEHGTGLLEFEVLRISEEAVLVECKGIQLALTLAPSIDVRK